MAQSANILQPGQGVLSLHNIRLPVYLGVTEAERAAPQQVTISIRVTLPGSLPACQTDEINDTFCYYKLFSAVETLCTGHPFHLLENLCYKIHNTVKKLVHNEEYDVPVWVKVEKTYPPIAHKMESAGFEYYA